MARVTRIIALSAILLLTLGVSGAAAEGETSSVEDLTVTSGAETLDVAGKGVFTAPAVEVGTDATGDGRMPGSDLVSASITQLSQSQLRFDLKVADLPPGLGGTPEVLNYNWGLSVTQGGKSSEVSLQAWRSSTAADLLCDVVFACPAGEANGSPRFTVNTCAIDEQTGNNSCTAVGVNGEFTEDGLYWLVPASMINARGAATLHPDGDIAASYGGSGLYWNTAGTGGDTLTWNSFELSVPTVNVGIAPADTAEGDVPLTTAAPVNGSSGSFSTSLPLPAPGSYRVTAEACLGDASCGTASEIVQID